MFDRALLALPGSRRALAVVCALTLLRAFCIVGQAWGLARALVGFWEGSSLGALAGWIALFALCFLLRQAIGAAQERFMERFARERADELRTRLLEALYDAGPAVVSRHGSAATVAAAIEGVRNVETYLGIMYPKVVAVVVVPLVLLVSIFPLDWVSGLIALVCFPFIILYMVMIGYTAKDDAARRHGEFVRMSNHFIDSLRGIDVLRAFGRARAHATQIFEASERFRDMTMKTLRIATLSSAVLDMFATLALAAVAIMLGFRLVEGALPFFPALAVLILVPEYFRPIREFASDYHATLDGRTSLAEIERIVSRADELRDDRARRTCALPAGSGDGSCTLAFHDVSFERDGAHLLGGVTFTVTGPARIGVVGASGAGKSTLLALIGGFEDPASGVIAVDGAKTSSLGVEAWRSRVALMPQDPYLFHGTLRENIAFYAPDAPDERVAEAVRAAGLEAVVEALPAGLDTEMGAGARSFSGGEAQRIALARALLDPHRDVLLFDEPTAHLDIETEYDLKERMLPAMEGKLVFFATHRLHWLLDMDYVLVLDGGRLVWAGKPDGEDAVRAMGGDVR